MFSRLSQYTKAITNQKVKNSLIQTTSKRNFLGSAIVCSSAIGSLYYCWWRGYKYYLTIYRSQIRHVPLLERPSQYKETMQPTIDYMKYPISIRIFAYILFIFLIFQKYVGDIGSWNCFSYITHY